MKILMTQNRKGFLLAILAIVFHSMLMLFQATLLGLVFDHLDNVTQPWLLALIGAYIALTLGCSLYIDFAKESLKRDIRRFLLEKGVHAYMHMDELAFEKQDMSACVNTMTTEVDLVIEQYVTPLLNTFGLAASIVLSSVYFLFLDWRMLAFLYAGSALTFAINRLCQPRLAKNQKQILRAKSDWIATLQGFYRNFSTIKDYGLEERESEALARSSDGSVQAHFRGGLELANLDSVDLDIGMAMFFGLLILCGTLFSGTISPGLAITAIQLSNSIVDPIINFTTIWNRLNASRPVLERFLAMETTASAPEPLAIDGPVETIEIDTPVVKVGDKALLHDIHLRFEKGKKYIIVGPSGCGKTTLLRTLKGAIPSSDVRLNGKAGLSMKAQLCVVGQHMALFPWTLAQNIALNEPAAPSTIDALLAQVHLSHLDPGRLMRLDNDTLSGGELQRVQLARVLAQHRPWLFLDEAFSALDHETTCRLEAMYVADPDRSVISICHKPVMKNLKYYDKIITMESGTVQSVLDPAAWKQKNGALASSAA